MFPTLAISCNEFLLIYDLAVKSIDYKYYTFLSLSTLNVNPDDFFGSGSKHPIGLIGRCTTVVRIR